MYFNPNREMNYIKDRHFSLNRILLLAVGLWPYQKSKLVRFQFICLFSILITCIIFQFATFMTSKYTTALAINVLSVACGHVCSAIKYNAFYINGETVKYLMEQLERVCDDLKDNNEIAIIEKYGSKAKRYTSGITMFFLISMSIVMITQLQPGFLDVILSINKSQPRRLQITAEYFIDQERYFYLLALHMIIATCIGLFALVAIGTMFITYLFHVCGMFSLASYRIEHAMKMHISKDISLRTENMAYEGIVCAIDIHRKAMMFSKYLISSFNVSFMLLIIFGVFTVSLNFFQIVLSGCNVEELFLFLAISIFSLMYMFFANLVGQEIIDHNNHVFTSAYEMQWYVAPLRTQRLILFLLLKGSKIFGLHSMGGFFIASLQCFATLINASISYFAVMYSIQ